MEYCILSLMYLYFWLMARTNEWILGSLFRNTWTYSWKCSSYSLEERIWAKESNVTHLDRKIFRKVSYSTGHPILSIMPRVKLSTYHTMRFKNSFTNRLVFKYEPWPLTIIIVIEHDISTAFGCSSSTMVSICFARYKKYSGCE